jgi:hypothetical protein
MCIEGCGGERPHGKRALGRHRLRWEDIITIDIKLVGWGGMDWVDPTQHKAGGKHLLIW